MLTKRSIGETRNKKKILIVNAYLDDSHRIGSFMPRTIVLCLLLIFAIALAGCPVESVNPLFNLNDSKPDEQLSGTWISKGESGEAWYLHIGKGDVELSPNSKSVAPAHAISIRYQTDGRVSLGTFKIFPTQIANQKYASARIAGPKENGLGYLLVKYSIDQNQKLCLWFIDEKIARNDKLNLSRRKVIDSTAKLRAVVASANYVGLFSSEPDVVFEKLAPQ